MKSNKFCVFICTKQPSAGDTGGCCGAVGASEIYRTFQAEIAARHLADRVEVRSSGCLNRCADGAVALVYQPDWGDLAWLPTKLRLKIRRRFFPNRHFYGRLTPADVPEVIESHFLHHKPLKRLQIIEPST